MRPPKSHSIVTTPLFITVIFLFAAAAVHAQKKSSQPSNASATDQWLQFRGPNGSGVAERCLEDSRTVRAIVAGCHSQPRVPDGE
jgi:hypothetical protein